MNRNLKQATVVVLTGSSGKIASFYQHCSKSFVLRALLLQIVEFYSYVLVGTVYNC